MKILQSNLDLVNKLAFIRYFIDCIVYDDTLNSGIDNQFAILHGFKSRKDLIKHEIEKFLNNTNQIKQMIYCIESELDNSFWYDISDDEYITKQNILKFLYKYV